MCTDVPIARTGMQMYLGSELGPDLEPDASGRIMVDRPEDEVFRPESIASVAGKPVTNDHPDEGTLLTPDNWKDYAVGEVHNPHRGTGGYRNFLMADLVIKDPETIADVEAGKRQVSAGYDCRYQSLGRGRARQHDLMLNHVAVVDRARCGALCSIQDSDPLFRYTPSRRRRMAATARRSVLDDGAQTPRARGLIRLIHDAFRAGTTNDAAALDMVRHEAEDEFLPEAGGHPGGADPDLLEHPGEDRAIHLHLHDEEAPEMSVESARQISAAAPSSTGDRRRNEDARRRRAEDKRRRAADARKRSEDAKRRATDARGRRREEDARRHEEDARRYEEDARHHEEDARHEDGYFDDPEGEGGGAGGGLAEISDKLDQVMDLLGQLADAESEEVEMQNQEEESGGEMDTVDARRRIHDKRREIMDAMRKFRRRSEDAGGQLLNAVSALEHDPESLGESPPGTGPGPDSISSRGGTDRRRTTDAMTLDSTGLKDTWEQVIAKGEIIAPGTRLPTFDAAAPRKVTVDRMCAFRRRVLLDGYGQNPEARSALDQITEGQNFVLGKATCDQVATLFNATATAVAARNRAAAAQTGSGQISMDRAVFAGPGQGPMADRIRAMNKLNREGKLTVS